MKYQVKKLAICAVAICNICSCMCSVVVYAIYVVGSGTCSPGDGSALKRVCRGTGGLDNVNFLHFQHK